MTTVMNFEEYDAIILLEQLLGEQSAAAQSQGFTVRSILPELPCRVRADVLYLKRVFDNLFDNVRKYADPGKPVDIAVLEENGQLQICIGNSVAPNPGKVESSLIGLKTCRQIMKLKLVGLADFISYYPSELSGGMTQSEITANYGQVFSNANDGKSYISKKINLKFIPDKVSFSQYLTILFKSPDYLLKFWNSVILVVPIVLAQLMVASVAAYGFTRWRGRVRDAIFFAYVILMLMSAFGPAAVGRQVSDGRDLLLRRLLLTSDCQKV